MTEHDEDFNEIEQTGEAQSVKDTFSFFDVLEERTYPTDEVTISIDEAAGYELNKLAMKLHELRTSEGATEEDYAAVEQQADDLRERIERSQFTFQLKGVSDDRITDAMEVVEARFEDKKVPRKKADGSLQRELPKSEGLNYARFLNAVTFAMHIEQIVRHKNGSVMTAPDADEIAAFFDKAPHAAQERVATAIQSLRVASSTYEASLDEGFFPKP